LCVLLTIRNAARIGRLGKGNSRKRLGEEKHGSPDLSRRGEIHPFGEGQFQEAPGGGKENLESMP
jgi:hypothetical protein